MSSQTPEQFEITPNSPHPSGWFEGLYANAQGDSGQVPWANMTASAYLKDWLLNLQPESGNGLEAVVVGCGLGDDAEALAAKGYTVTAFDISSTAIAWCKERFPDSAVNYVVADLFAVNPEWERKFDLVFEARTIQSLPLEVRSQTMAAIGKLVAEGGILLIVTVTRDTPEPPSGPPYPLSLDEIDYFQQLGFQEIRRHGFSDKNSRFSKRLRVEYRR